VWGFIDWPGDARGVSRARGGVDCRGVFMGDVQMKWDASKWVGRKFRDNATGETLIIPENVRAKQFFAWGESFIDVGDGEYSRAGGDFIELTEPVTAEDMAAEHCPACGSVLTASDTALCLCPQCGCHICSGVV